MRELRGLREMSQNVNFVGHGLGSCPRNLCLWGPQRRRPIRPSSSCVQEASRGISVPCAGDPLPSQDAPKCELFGTQLRLVSQKLPRRLPGVNGRSTSGCSAGTTQRSKSFWDNCPSGYAAQDSSAVLRCSSGGNARQQDRKPQSGSCRRAGRRCRRRRGSGRGRV